MIFSHELNALSNAGILNDKGLEVIDQLREEGFLTPVYVVCSETYNDPEKRGKCEAYDFVRVVEQFEDIFDFAQMRPKPPQGMSLNQSTMPQGMSLNQSTMNQSTIPQGMLLNQSTMGQSTMMYPPPSGMLYPPSSPMSSYPLSSPMPFYPPPSKFALIITDIPSPELKKGIEERGYSVTETGPEQALSLLSYPFVVVVIKLNRKGNDNPMLNFVNFKRPNNQLFFIDPKSEERGKYGDQVLVARSISELFSEYMKKSE